MNKRMREHSRRRAWRLGVAAVLLVLPATSLCATARRSSPELPGQLGSEQLPQEQRDREQEKKDLDQERLDHLQELYDQGRGFLDEEDYGHAVQLFTELAQMNGPQTDAALYWLAYAQNKQGKRDAALSTIAELKKSFPQSRWNKDAAALEIEVRQSTGAKTNPEAVNDEDLKLLALQGLISSDPQKALPLVEKILNGSSSPKVKSRALFLLAQSGTPQAMEILGKIALGQSNPELQRKAVEYLGIFGGERAEKTLGDVYAATADPSIKRAVLRSYMVSGNKQGLLNAAKNEKNEDLRREAIKQLGTAGGETELEQLYRSETSTAVRREILQAFFLAGDSKRLVQAAENEKDPELRRAAIRNLGLVGGDNASNALQAIYAKESDRSLKEEVLNAYFLQGNSKALVAIARSEKDAALRKKAVEKLSLIGDKTATDYMMELLQK